MKKNNEDICRVNISDKEMLLAMQKARDTFKDFKREVTQDYSRKIPVLSTILVKAYFYDNDLPNDGEHLWLRNIDFEDEYLVGEIASPPEHVKSVEMGERVTITLEQLSDWLYVYDGKAQGAFTVKLLRERMSPRERQEHDEGYPYSFD